MIWKILPLQDKPKEFINIHHLPKIMAQCWEKGSALNQIHQLFSVSNWIIGKTIKITRLAFILMLKFEKWKHCDHHTWQIHTPLLLIAVVLASVSSLYIIHFPFHQWDLLLISFDLILLQKLSKSEVIIYVLGISM